jgi:hypothetical protein
MNQQTAQGLASLGRGPDSMLVHMAPSEVAGLQALALKNGGSLTINPETGLPEAGFLSKILPMVLGAGLAATGIGAPMAAMIVGGGYGVAKGSLKEGLMAGLGAYGGAGLGAGLMGAGTESLISAAAPTVDVGQALAASAGDATANLAANAIVPTGTAGALSTMGQGISSLGSEAGRTAFMNQMGGGMGLLKTGAMAAAPMLMPTTTTKAPDPDPGMIRPYTYSREKVPSAFEDVAGEPLSSKERRYFTDKYTALTPYKAPGPEYMAEGGPVEDMSDANAIGMNTGYPQADIRTGAYATPYQQPISRNVVTGVQGIGVDPYTGQAQFAGGGSVSPNGGASSDGMLARLFAQANGQSGGSNASIGGYSYDPATGQYSGGTPIAGQPSGVGIPAQYTNGSIGGFSFNPATGQYTKLDSAPEFLAYQKAAAEAAAPMDSGSSGAAAGGLMPLAQGGISNLGDYSDGGRLLRGPGDGVSDNIPASIGGKQEARLADGEFVVPARIVSELGNGSTEAGARQLYAMMDRVQKARRKTVGKDKVATNSRAAKLLPA